MSDHAKGLILQALEEKGTATTRELFWQLFECLIEWSHSRRARFLAYSAKWSVRALSAVQWIEAPSS